MRSKTQSKQREEQKENIVRRTDKGMNRERTPENIDLEREKQRVQKKETKKMIIQMQRKQGERKTENVRHREDEN